MPPRIMIGPVETPTLVVIGGSLLLGIVFTILGAKSIRGLIDIRKDKGIRTTSSTLSGRGPPKREDHVRGGKMRTDRALASPQ